MRPLSPLTLLALVACGGGPPPDGVSLSPENPITTDDLIPSVGGSEDLSDYSVRWSVNGTRRLDLDGAELIPATETHKGEVWTVGVASSAKGEYGEASVTIQNSPPTATLTLLPEEPRTRDPLRTTVSRSDIDSGNVGIRYEWSVDGTPVDFTGPILPAAQTSKGQVWEVTVTPSDDEGDGEPVTASVTINNSPPSVQRAIIDPAFPTGNDTLSCDGIGWTDEDEEAPSYTYQWVFEGAVVGTEATFSAAELSRGDAVTCRLTPTDGDATGPTVESVPVTITNAPPIVTGVAITPDPATRSNSLSVEVGEIIDIDDDPVSLKYRWYVNESSVSSEETLDPRYYTRDDEVYVTVIPSDGFTTGEAVTSPTITIANTPPQITTLTLNRSELFTDTVVRATAAAKDLDRDDVTISYEWFVNGTSVATTQELDGDTAFDKGDTVVVEVTANDGVDDSDVSTSSTLTVKNTPPTAPEIRLNPDDAEPGDEVVCEVAVASTDLRRLHHLQLRLDPRRLALRVPVHHHLHERHPAREHLQLRRALPVSGHPQRRHRRRSLGPHGAQLPRGTVRVHPLRQDREHRPQPVPVRQRLLRHRPGLLGRGRRRHPDLVRAQDRHLAHRGRRRRGLEREHQRRLRRGHHRRVRADRG